MELQYISRPILKFCLLIIIGSFSLDSSFIITVFLSQLLDLSKLFWIKLSESSALFRLMQSGNIFIIINIINMNPF